MSQHAKQPAKRVVLDGFEGETARIEQGVGETKDVARKRLPEDAQEGDVLKDVDGKYVVNKVETQRVRQEAQAKLDAMNKQGGRQEIDL